MIIGRRMDGVDIGLFDFDRHNTLYYFALNAEEQIYLRYGGRTAESPTSHLDFESLELALRIGIEEHGRYLEGRFEPPTRPAARFPRQIEGLREREMSRGRCVECHLIADYEATDRQRAGVLDKAQEMFRSPDPANFGVEFEVPKGLEIGKVEGPARDAGVSVGDLVTSIDGDRVLTFGDFQHRFDQLPRTRETARLGLERAGRGIEVEVELPLEWWASDLFFRYWSIEPLLYFASDRLDGAEKRRLGLEPAGFACRVRFVERRAAVFGSHELAPGDVIFSVNGSEMNPLTTDCELHLKLQTTAGEPSTLGVMRNGERIEMQLVTGTQRFRK